MLKKALLSVLGVAAVASSANAAVIINEIYPGGGGSGATNAFTRDFVEIYNTGTSAVDLTGYKLQYSAAAATSSFTNTIFNFAAGSQINAGDFITIATGAAGSGGVALTAAQVTAFAPTTTSASLSGTAGSVRLLDATGATSDLVGYGAVVNSTDGTVVKFEGTAAAGPANNTVSLNRTAFSDTNVNSTDFTQLVPTPTAGVGSTAIPTPEPASLAVLGLIGLVGLRRRK